MNMKSALESFENGKKAIEKDKLDLFHFISKGKVEKRLRVIRFHGEERVNTPYELDVEVAAPLDLDPLTALEETLLGNPGTLVMMDSRDVPRAVHGLVTSYEVDRSLEADVVRVRMKLSSRLSLLKMREHSRIFQDQTVPAIVERLMREWRIAHSFELAGKYTPRTYCTQYHETDYDFLRRILAQEGIFFYFRQDPEADAEHVVFSDDALYKAIPGRHGKLTMRSGRFEIDEGDVIELGVRRKIRPTAARIGDFDFRHPHLPLRSLQLTADPKGVAGDLGSERMGTYTFGHETEHEESQSAEKREEKATRMLEALRADGLSVAGTSRSRKLLPGHAFTLDGHFIESLNRDWVVVAVMHEGRTPEFGGLETDDVYSNEFEAAAIESALRMPPVVARRVQHGNQTASVVGGAEGEPFTDSYGRIKVQFHWDLEGRKDDRASCWIRVAQPWAGAGYGTQFVPRVGSEVVVTFLDGDPDRPLVIGTVYNGTSPQPFGLPSQRTKSGFRSMSTPGGDGGSEISFDDDKGREQVLVKAQRNFDVEVGSDHGVTVGGNATLRVEGQLTENITGTHTTTVVGGQTTLVTLQKTTQVLGDVIDAVRGTTDRRVSGDENVRIEGMRREDIASHETFVRNDAVHKVRGHLATIVGEDASPSSATVHVEGTLAGYASKTTELIAEKGIILRCGESSIRIGPDAVEILSPRVTFSGKKVEAAADERVTFVSKDGIVMKGERFHAMGKSSSLLLFKDADVGGDRVKLNCVIDEAAIVAPSKPTTRIQLVDEGGAPARRRRFVIVSDDGERAGVLDDKGEAEIELDASAKIYFPDVDKPQEA
ncbi:MAG: type VI secretion system tip protein VgrG [Polyangiaceae bacterium]|nr:type VI secretion system tip protein VgrG [Polyangiaceae bacterium]